MNISDSPDQRQKLAPVLLKLRSRIRRIQSLRGGARVATLMLGGLFLLAAIDFFYAPLPVVVRWLMPVAWIGAVLWGATEWLVKPLSRKLDFVRLARWLETRHPELEERISTVLELDNHPNAGVSSSLLDDLAETAIGDLNAIDPEAEVTSGLAKRWLWPAAFLLALWILVFAIWPDLASRQVVRVLAPNSSYGTAGGMIEVFPGNIEVIEGDAVDITARWLKGDAVKPLEIVIELEDGSELVEAMQPGEKGYGFHLGKADHTFDYTVRAGRETSDRHTVTVRPVPRLVDPRARLEFPAYTQWQARESGLGSAGIRAIAGTRVKVQTTLNTAIDSAQFTLNGEGVEDVRIERAAEGGKLAISFDLAEAGMEEAVLSLTHPLGRKFEVLRFPVETVPDVTPTVTWLAPLQEEMKLRPDDLFAYSYEAGDDVGLGRVEFEVKAGSDDMELFNLPLPERYGVGEPLVWRGSGEQAVGVLRERWPRVRKFEVRMRIEDARSEELGGPGVGVSEWKTIRIDDRAQSLAKQELQAQHSDARETVEEARSDIREAKDKLNQPKEKPLDEQDKKELAEAREKLAEAQEKLQELAERMQEGVHEAQRDEVQQAAEKLNEAVEHTEKAALQDEAEAQQDELEAAKKAAEKAEEQLRELQEEIRKMEPQINDLAKLKELEQEQRELARQAASEAQKPSDPEAPKPDEQWSKKQEQVAEELQREVAQRPEAKAESLKQQAEEAKELAERAEEAAADQAQLEQLAEQLAENGEPDAEDGEKSEAAEESREKLREALAERQKDLAEEVAEKLGEARENRDASANALPEAAAAAKEAAESLEKAAQGSEDENGESSEEQSGEQAGEKAENPAGDQQAAEQAAQAAEALAEAAEAAAGESAEESDEGTGEASPPDAAEAARAQDLSDLAEEQQDLAEAIEAFAEGDDAAALEQLAELEAAQAGELAEDIAEAPGLNNGQSMAQAARAAEAGAQQAVEAAQSTAGGEPQAAAAEHEAASGKLGQAAEALEQAADHFAQQAEMANEAAQGKPRAGQAPVPGEALAEAFHEAAQAADAKSGAEAAEHAQAAAEALAEGAQAAMNAMQGRKPSKPGKPGQPNPNPGPPGDSPQDDPRNAEPDQGVPPELAKLGVSSEDWAQIQSALKAETGAGASIKVPEEYRSLVRSYFEEMAKGGEE